MVSREPHRALLVMVYLLYEHMIYYYYTYK